VCRWLEVMVIVPSEVTLPLFMVLFLQEAREKLEGIEAILAFSVMSNRVATLQK
jgi:hypothetical protein